MHVKLYDNYLKFLLKHILIPNLLKFSSGILAYRIYNSVRLNQYIWHRIQLLHIKLKDIYFLFRSLSCILKLIFNQLQMLVYYFIFDKSLIDL